ncbi:MAG: hypothetical protein ACT4NY_22815 [Pseudonocardiales bacterium]
MDDLLDRPGAVRGQRTEFLCCRGLGWRVGFEQATDVYLAGCQLDYTVIRVDKVKGLLDSMTALSEKR